MKKFLDYSPEMTLTSSTLISTLKHSNTSEVIPVKLYDPCQMRPPEFSYVGIKFPVVVG
jgi:hypothetical protein